MAPLVAAYGPWFLWPERPATEEKKTMRVAPWPSAARPVWNALVKLTARMSSQSASVYSPIGLRRFMPTLWTKKSKPPRGPGAPGLGARGGPAARRAGAMWSPGGGDVGSGGGARAAQQG